MLESEYSSDDEIEWADSVDDEEDTAVPCPECGAEMSVYAEVCPACGHWLTEWEQRSAAGGAATTERIKKIGLVALALLAALLLLSMFS